MLSFPPACDAMPAAEDAIPLGDLAICAPVVAREAREQGKTAAGALGAHGRARRAALLGYDHENDRDAELMEAREVRILAQFWVCESLWLKSKRSDRTLAAADH